MMVIAYPGFGGHARRMVLQCVALLTFFLGNPGQEECQDIEGQMATISLCGILVYFFVSL